MQYYSIKNPNSQGVWDKRSLIVHMHKDGEWGEKYLCILHIAQAVKLCYNDNGEFETFLT